MTGMPPDPSDRPAPDRTGTRARLTERMAAEITEKFGDPIAAQQRASEIVDEKHRKTMFAVKIGALALIAGYLSHLLHASETVTLVIVGGGLLWAGIGTDPEYARASAENFAAIVTTLATAFRKALGLSTT